MTEYILRNNLPYLQVNVFKDLLPMALQNQMVNEATYKDILQMIDEDFLMQGLRRRALTGLDLEGFQDKSAIFSVKSAKYMDNQIVYTNIFRMKEWDNFIDEESLRPIERARELFYRGNLELHCTCPSFLYWGYQHILTKNDAALVPEIRPPVKRNPRQRGIVCKHLNRTVRAFPFWASRFASHIRRNHAIAEGYDDISDAKSKLVERAFNDPDFQVRYKDVI